MTNRRTCQLLCSIGVFVAGLSLFACHRAATNADDPIERHTEAMGGRAAIEAIQSIQVKLHITDPDFEADGIYYAARPGRMRIDINNKGKHVFTEAFDGKRGWEWKGEGSQPETASPKAAAALFHGVELPGKLFGLHELQNRGHKLEPIGREQIDGINYHALRLTLRDGYVTTLYIDPNNWLITRRRDVRPLHVDIDPTPTTIEQRNSDFHEIMGVPFAFANEEVDLKTGKVLETTTIKEIKINPPIADGFFEKL